MRAIYKSAKAYLQLSKGDVLRSIPVMGQTYEKGKYLDTGKTAGVMVRDTENNRLEVYQFCESVDHNRLTLTDPEEINGMRAYIERRHDDLITEELFEGNEADLEEPVMDVQQEPEKASKRTEKLNYEELSDWDKKMLTGMVTR